MIIAEFDECLSIPYLATAFGAFLYFHVLFPAYALLNYILDRIYLITMLKETAVKWIDENEKEIIGLSDTAWDYAELGLLEHKTSKLWADEIERHGFKVDRGVAEMPTAFIAVWGEGKPTIGILGELDALAGCSQKTVPYREPVIKDGPGHGCGHNIYGASGLAGVIALKTTMEDQNIPGTIKYYGCPAEETLVGKVWMVKHGLFDGVDAVISHHPGSANTASLRSSNAMNSVKFHFHGRTAHAAGDPGIADGSGTIPVCCRERREKDWPVPGASGWRGCRFAP